MRIVFKLKEPVRRVVVSSKAKYFHVLQYIGDFCEPFKYLQHLASSMMIYVASL